ncbi:MAG: osmotically inducible protein C [bacterium]|nr:osmotically inducible protein C [bacterium]
MSSQMTVSFGGGKKVIAEYNEFEIRTDQSVKSGGEATAPEPYDLFLASLATCAGYYVLSFCDKRDIPTEGIRVVQNWERDAEKRLTKIRLRIEVPESFPAKYHGALVRAADQCAVKKTLANPPEIVTETVVA